MSLQPLPTRAVAERSADQRGATVAAVIAWAQRAGAPLHGVAPRVDAAGNVEMYALRAIRSGDVMLALPRQLMIIDNEVAPGEVAPHAALAAWLAVAARDPDSPWRAYLDDLPPHVELPLFRADLAALAGTTAHAHVVADRRDLLAAHAPTQLPLADFAWGWAIVRSRAYHAPGSFGPHLALMPIVDLFDHGHGDTTWAYDHVDARFVVTAERAIAAGESVTFSYGDLGNGRLLAHYGFTLPDDPFAEALLVFERSAIPVTLRLDHRFEHALNLARELAGSDDDARVLRQLADAAHRSIAILANARDTGDREWDAHAARVRAGELAVLTQYALLAERGGSLYRDYRAALDAST